MHFEGRGTVNCRLQKLKNETVTVHYGGYRRRNSCMNSELYDDGWKSFDNFDSGHNKLHYEEGEGQFRASEKIWCIGARSGIFFADTVTQISILKFSAF